MLSRAFLAATAERTVESVPLAGIAGAARRAGTRGTRATAALASLEAPAVAALGLGGWCLGFVFKGLVGFTSVVPSLSMFPTMDIGDLVFVDLVTYRARQPRAGDICIFLAPEKRGRRGRRGRHGTAASAGAAAPHDGGDPLDAGVESASRGAPTPGPSGLDRLKGIFWGDKLGKRIVAVGGDTVEVCNGVLYVNDVALDERYLHEKPRYSMRRRVVPAGEVFVLGDNRNFSEDSHVFGSLPVDRCLGRVGACMWPPPRMRILLDHTSAAQGRKETMRTADVERARRRLSEHSATHRVANGVDSFARAIPFAELCEAIGCCEMDGRELDLVERYEVAPAQDAPASTYVPRVASVSSAWSGSNWSFTLACAPP